MPLKYAYTFNILLLSSLEKEWSVISESKGILVVGMKAL
jgi:hypothetical protein